MWIVKINFKILPSAKCLARRLREKGYCSVTVLEIKEEEEEEE